MKGRLVLLGAALTLLALWGSLPAGRELDSMVLVRTIGIDRAAGDYVVTVSTVQRTRGIQRDGEAEPLVLSAQGDDPFDALAGIGRLAGQEVFLGYADQLFFGESMVQGGILPILEHFAADRELGVGAQVWLIRGSAQGAVRGEEELPDLPVLENEDSRGEKVPPRSVGRILTDLMERGYAYIPALKVEKGILLEVGYGVVDGEHFWNWLEQKEKREVGE